MTDQSVREWLDEQLGSDIDDDAILDPDEVDKVAGLAVEKWMINIRITDFNSCTKALLLQIISTAITDRSR